MPLILILFVLAVIIIGPLLVLWSLNTLFGLGIDYNFFTWVAVVILVSAIRANVEINKS